MQKKPLEDMLKKIAFFLFFTTLLNSVIAQNFEYQITQFNDKQEYEKSILLIDSVINHTPQSDPLIVRAYIQKTLTYKRLFNYTTALKNLETALDICKKLKEEQRNQWETQVLVETMFIYFDLQQMDLFYQVKSKLNPKYLHLIDAESAAFYTSTLGILEMKQKNYNAAEPYFYKAIDILKGQSPKHLPNIYRALVALYSETGKEDKVLEAFNKGLEYAENYNMHIYKIIMYEAITKHYTQKEDYKNAFYYQNIVSKERTKYNANNRSGELTVLENELIQKHKNKEIAIQKRNKLYLGLLCVSLLITVIVMVKLLISNKQKQKLIERENQFIRNEINLLSQLKKQKNQLETDKLTPRQKEIIELVKQGKTNKQIGSELYISENTVKYHLKLIYEILGLENRTEIKNRV